MIRAVIEWAITSMVLIVAAVILTIVLIDDHEAPTRIPTPWALGTER